MVKSKTLCVFKKYNVISSLLQKEIERFKKRCSEFRLRHQTSRQKLIHFDKYCSQKDIVEYLLAYQDKEIIGMIIMYKRKIELQGKKITLGGIGSLRVRDDKRKKGIASFLLATAIKKLKNIGCNVVFLNTDITNPILVSLYKKFEFILLDKPYTFLGKSGKRYTENNGMIALLKSTAHFLKSLKNVEVLDIGKGNW